MSVVNIYVFFGRVYGGQGVAWGSQGGSREAEGSNGAFIATLQISGDQYLGYSEWG